MFVQEFAVPISVVFSFLVLAAMLYFRPIDIRRLTLDPVNIRSDAGESVQDSEVESAISVEELNQRDEKGSA
ncbi:hypothetical protein ACFPOD_14990 [Nitratireductor kimnyeongensis]|uniref:Uncharacterized protein n=1 Tax=Nitratireductor kimnyeongensis TaxID=430679 RepID=A0ABW0TC30_9HYPH|nr:hypothetical protein [Nitratireductor kimnyeongensis]QZZ36706.1 hypothetical protein KW403_06130 [Nitratireductor kimnyeongensis]